jgi:N-methylhydantoinase A/oxoprolinase/acetone carboxylase beta subunit
MGRTERPWARYRLGIDVGGTNTDAVLLDRGGRPVAKAKTPTTADVTTGIVRAIDRVLLGAEELRERIGHVMLGTTHAMNAVLQRRGLRRVGVLRIGSPATHAVRPLFGWPDDLRRAVSAGEAIVGGGHEYDGRELAPFDREATARFVAALPDDVEAIAITSVFAPVSSSHELAAAELVGKLRPELHASLSHEIGSVGLLERENATVLNAALAGLAQEVAEGIREALAARNLDPVTFFAQNDGTLMGIDHATRFPVLTIGSGPANSIRGAAHLTGLTDGIVADVGGTSTDIGVLVGGFPRESAVGVEVGGVRTNFRMPDLVSISLGGGTVVEEVGGDVRVGPESVGYAIGGEALVFGGSTPTLTDAAVACGRVRLGEVEGVRRCEALLARAMERSDAMLADAIDRIKVAKGELPLVVVGGGSILVPERVPGVSEIHRPEHFEVANAIGAAIAAVGGQAERVVAMGGRTRKAVIADVAAEARARAIQAGADPARVEIVEVDEIPLAYLAEPASRVRVKAAGPLGTS